MNINRKVGSGIAKSLDLNLGKTVDNVLRKKTGEYRILYSHDKVFFPVNVPVRLAYHAISATTPSMRQMGELKDTLPLPDSRAQARAFIAELRTLLTNDALERDLQNKLLDFLALICRPIQEVRLVPTEDFGGMRLDIVCPFEADLPPEVLELKRGSHLLLAHEGKARERRSKKFDQTRRQGKAYFRRLKKDPGILDKLNQENYVQIVNPEVRIIAGKRLSSEAGYHLLSQIDPSAEDTELRVYISTWNGYIAELERIFC